VHAALNPHDPIYIDGNAGFTIPDPVNGGGSGTEDDPYIIENWDISAENTHGIRIRNTTAHFIIRNCYVHDGREEHKHGVYLENVMNGKIDGTTSNNNLHGIFLVYFSDGVVDDCVAENNSGKGIWLWYSPNNAVTNCTARNNNFEDIHLWYSSNNHVTNCTLESDDHGITIHGSENNTVSNCTVKVNNFGIYIHSSSSNAVTSCTVEGNNFGIAIVSSSNNVITNCTVENNNLGAKLSDSSDNNRIHHNKFVNNEQQVLNYCTNFWDNGYPSGGNYWSDYTGVDADGDWIGDTPYSIRGGTNKDRYPLMKPFGEIPSGESNWPLIAGIVGVIVIIGITVALYMRRR
jgi:parallel beta-helix repeat protein